MAVASVTQSLTLYQAEENLLALLDSEDLVSEQQVEQYKQELSEALKASIEKRQKVGEFLRMCELTCENVDAEKKRLDGIKARAQAAIQRVRSYVAYTIESLGQDGNGKWKRLDGRTVSFSLRNNPEHVEIWDEEQVPWQYLDITVTLPVALWQSLSSLYDTTTIKAAETKAKYCPNKRRIQEALTQGKEVSGACLQRGFGLVMR
jgi:Siphovirus Gp157